MQRHKREMRKKRQRIRGMPLWIDERKVKNEDKHVLRYVNIQKWYF